MNSVQYLVAFCIVAAAGIPLEDGGWHPYKYGDVGKYIPSNEGKYVHIPNPYIHLDNPYDGGFGPYAHDYEPYEEAATVDQYRYVLTPPKDIPYYKDGYYTNNGIKILRQKHNYNKDNYDFE
ncbi:putative cuticle protein [Operophtera brumata]|uniref:Putative cuticle protein n=1 Tax=Operophtera brumata TaxID=104452 RepID=A0A0L7LQH9_OPEBR|nr:putative cuticle protein [Operophtera brumata]